MVEEILFKIGCRVLDHNFPKIETLSGITEYIHSVEKERIFSLLRAIESSGQPETIPKRFYDSKISNNERDQLRGYLLSMSNWKSDFSAKDINILQLLPIWPTYSGDFISMDSTCHFPPRDLSPDFLVLHPYIIKWQGSDQLLNKMGLERLERPSFYQNVAIPAILKDFNLNRHAPLLLLILKEIHSISDLKFVNFLKNCKFVPSSGGSLKLPSELLHFPHVEDYFSQKESTNRFLHSAFTEESVVVSLKSLGMATAMNEMEMLARARTITTLAKENSNLALKRSK